MSLTFSKYEGTGNDFILIDDREEVFPLESADISKLCHRQYGIGADGLILMRPSTKGDISMRIVNSNGQEAEMCGNGLRCLVDFLCRKEGKRGDVRVETLEKVYECHWGEEGIRVKMGLPEVIQKERECTLVNVGVPHLVYFVDDLSRFDSEAKKRFSDTGVNINYATIVSHDLIRMRTFERGVENETHSCGTGATAVSFLAAKQHDIRGKVEVEFNSGERLKFDLLMENEILREIYMVGKACHIFDGTVCL